MSISRVYVRTLEKAARILGGQAELAAYLQVRREELAAWMEARNTLPSWAFITVVDLIASGPAAAGAAANPTVEADHATRGS
jgi:hypothetical protein